MVPAQPHRIAVALAASFACPKSIGHRPPLTLVRPPIPPPPPMIHCSVAAMRSESGAEVMRTARATSAHNAGRQRGSRSSRRNNASPASPVSSYPPRHDRSQATSARKSSNTVRPIVGGSISEKNRAPRRNGGDKPRGARPLFSHTGKKCPAPAAGPETARSRHRGHRHGASGGEAAPRPPRACVGSLGAATTATGASGALDAAAKPGNGPPRRPEGELPTLPSHPNRIRHTHPQG